MKKLIVTFSEIGLKELPIVGGKNASLGGMNNAEAKKRSLLASD